MQTVAIASGVALRRDAPPFTKCHLGAALFEKLLQPFAKIPAAGARSNFSMPASGQLLKLSDSDELGVK